MPAGDRHRTWFPEMIEALRLEWHGGLSFGEVIALRDWLDAILHRIRSDRQIRPPVFKCPHCGHVGEGAEPDVSVRAMILSLGRFDIAPAEEVKALEKAWAAYRKQTGLDLHGKPENAPRTGTADCTHLNGR
jgi:hypothetical protein